MVPRTRHATAILLAAGVWLGGALGVAAQEAPLPEKRNAVYAELGGCGFATLNYERALSQNAGLRVGGGVIPLIGADLVVMPSLAFGSRRHRFSAGVGVLMAWTETGSGIEPAGEIAYRLQRSSGFTFRASVGVLRGVGDLGSGVVAVPGISFGWNF